MSLYGPDAFTPGRHYHPASTPSSQADWVDFDDEIEVYVGRDPNAYKHEISAVLIKHYSGYFQRMLGTLDMSGDLSILRLPNEDPRIFSMVHSYIARRLWMDLPWGREPHKIITWDDIVELWLCGERLVMPLIQNAACNLFIMKIKELKELPDRWTTESIYERTKPGSPLRKMLPAVVRAMWLHDKSVYYSKLWTADLVNGTVDYFEPFIGNMDDLVMSQPIGKIRVSEKVLMRMRGCEWHVHEEGVTCEGSEEIRLPDHRQDIKERRTAAMREMGILILKGVDLK